MYPMISTADVPCIWWHDSSDRNAPKSTARSVLNGVINAPNEPVTNVSAWAFLQPFLR